MARRARPSTISAVVVHSDMGAHRLVLLLRRPGQPAARERGRGQRGNSLSVPTDCPQRDERLGWTGDIQVFAPTATFLFDRRDFLASWLADLAEEQEGRRRCALRRAARAQEPRPAAAWGDAPPWCRACCTSGSVISSAADQFASMRAWTDLLSGWRASDTCGRATSSTVTGSTRPPRRSTRPRKASQDLVATAPILRSGGSHQPSRRGPRRRGRGCVLRRVCRDDSSGVPGRVRHPGGRMMSGRADRVRTGHCLRAGCRLSSTRRWGTAGRPGPGVRISDRHRLRRHTDHQRCPDPDRSRRGGGPATPDRVPVLAVPGDDGARRRSGSAGTACCPTGPSTRAR